MVDKVFQILLRTIVYTNRELLPLLLQPLLLPPPQTPPPPPLNPPTSSSSPSPSLHVITLPCNLSPSSSSLSPLPRSLTKSISPSLLSSILRSIFLIFLYTSLFLQLCIRKKNRSTSWPLLSGFPFSFRLGPP